MKRTELTGVLFVQTSDEATRETAYMRLVAAVPTLASALCFVLWFAADAPTRGLATTFFVGLFAGVIASFWQRHLQRLHALVALGNAIAVLSLTVRIVDPTITATAPVLGFGLGLTIIPVHRGLLAPLVTRQRLRALVWLNVRVGPLVLLAQLTPRGKGQLEFILPSAIAAVSLALSTAIFLREIIEQLVEIVIWPLYRVRGYGPGLHKVPLRGPALVISNHAAWLDPIWLAKVLPCRLTPMMTSRFFDLPLVGWVVRVLAHAIRVPDTGFRREAPEIQQAIERLRQGHIVMIFPEGRMRRTEKLLLRRFGQGIYQILRVQPHIPVVACWIDGHWGSYTSFAGGPPTKNKKLDFWRKIRIGIAEPVVVPAEVLEDGNRTRRYLMQMCFDARKYLGLPVVEVQSFAEKEEDETEDER